MENFKEEAEFFKKKHNLTVDSSHLHTTGGDASSRNKVEKYFSTLTRKLIEKLENIYKYDLLLFNYEVGKFYNFPTGSAVPDTENIKKNKLQ